MGKEEEILFWKTWVKELVTPAVFKELEERIKNNDTLPAIKPPTVHRMGNVGITPAQRLN